MTFDLFGVEFDLVAVETVFGPIFRLVRSSANPYRVVGGPVVVPADDVVAKPTYRL